MPSGPARCSREGAGLGGLLLLPLAAAFIALAGLLLGAWLGWRKAAPGGRARGLWRGALGGLFTAALLSPLLAPALISLLWFLSEVWEAVRHGPY